MSKNKDIYDIRWERVEVEENDKSGQKSFDYAVISIKELHGLGHISFESSPLVIQVFFWRRGW